MFNIVPSKNYIINDAETSTILYSSFILMNCELNNLAAIKFAF